MGADRTELAGQAVADTLLSPALQASITGHAQDELLVLAVLREGGKYQIGDALLAHYGYYCDEALVLRQG